MGLFGGAGHSLEIVNRLSSEGMLIGIDRDEEAIESAKERLSNYSNVKYIHENHVQISEILSSIGITGVDRNSTRSWSFFISIR